MATISSGWWGRVLESQSGKAGSCFDMLEARSLLSGSPLPTLGDLESSNNAVIRLETNYGDIDIELFSSQAPVTVANILNYVTTGRLDRTFFHRSEVNPNPFVLQGGGFSYDDDAGPSSVDTDSPIIRETSGRNNLARTIAMARTDVINSATSQFFINYVDNAFLDPTSPNNGYTVFGRVIQGWDVVTAIQNLRAMNLTANTSFAGFTDVGNLLNTPVSDTYIEGQPIDERDLVQLINAEIIKPSGSTGFFSQRLAMPEGYRSSNTVENLELFNPNSATATYQVIARYESGIRDTVVASGSISAGSKLRVRLSDSGDSTLNLIRSSTPYAIVVETALPDGTANQQPIAASINRVDFHADTGEGLFNTAGYTDTQLQTWDFARIERNATSREFITWVNMGSTTGSVTVTLLSSGGDRTFVFNLDGYRRGGIALADSSTIPVGLLAARVTSTVPIVAFLSDWDLPASGQSPSTAYTPGFGVMGLPGGGADAGGLADAVIQTGFTNTLSISNPGSTVAVVTFKFWRTTRGSTEDPITQTDIVFAGARKDYVLDSTTLGIPLGERFTVTYTSGSAQIAVQYLSVDETGRHQSGTLRKDGVSTMLAGRLAPITHFADGGIDPSRNDGSQSELITIFNPFADPSHAFNYTVRYEFSDGTFIDAFTGSLSTNGRIVLSTMSSTAVLNKAASDAQFRTYAISVLAQAVGPDTTTTVAGLVQLTRTDTTLGRAIATSGSASGFGYEFDDTIFGPGGSTG
ncbi:Peptidyl-prolyl cis-trans isomerase cyp18 [Phycisphaerales bacterium]|nr:Peptidyl-prolyl cis-trans isomerase cyp18 [Phycisphaerales bacterium]